MEIRVVITLGRKEMMRRGIRSFCVADNFLYVVLSGGEAVHLLNFL